MEALFTKRTVLLSVVAILILSTLPGDSSPNIEIEHLDKIVHFTMYAVFSAILNGYYVKTNELGFLKNGIATFLLASAYGILMEILQYYFLESRSFEVYDIISNIIGSFIGIFITIIFINSKK